MNRRLPWTFDLSFPAKESKPPFWCCPISNSLISSPNFNELIIWAISNTSGWAAAECVETWKLPGTLLTRKKASKRHPFPLLISCLVVFSRNPTSCLPMSSWISSPTAILVKQIYVVLITKLRMTDHCTIGWELWCLDGPVFDLIHYLQHFPRAAHFHCK